jgi:hypothetical protein
MGYERICRLWMEKVVVDGMGLEEGMRGKRLRGGK